MELTKITETIQTDLEKVEKTIQRYLRADNLIIQSMVDYLSHSTGKKVRPSLALFSARCVGKVTEKVLGLGAALEMLHVATLIHDDIIDGSETRRSQKTLNFKWGNALSVLMGDYVFASSFYLMTKTMPGQVLDVLADTTNIICQGEISETANRFNVDLTMDHYLKMIEQKTASLFAASCQTGCMLGQGNARQVSGFQQFGLNVGIAFQIIDDALDFMGDRQKIGKPVMSDLLEGKMTMPSIHCMGKLPTIEKKRFKSIILKKHKTKKDLETIGKLVQRTDSVEYSSEQAGLYVGKAKAALDSLKLGNRTADLIRFAEFLVQRDF